ncbi:hypothetical protein TH0249_10300 [Helicobacter pylori]|nr:hypothetical protein [Helicobacter pylori]
MDLRSLENALNNGDFKEQVYRSLEGIYQISNVLNKLDILKYYTKYDLEIIEKIQAMKNALAGYEISKQELEAQINALVNSLEAAKQELEARLNMELQIVRNNETQKLNEAGNKLKNNLVAELTEAKNNLAQALKSQIQGTTKFLGFYVHGTQSYFENLSDKFMKLFEFANIGLKANKSYIVQFSMPYELGTDGLYGNNMGEMVLCLEAENKVYPIINSFYQNKTADLNNQYKNKIIGTYKVNCIFKMPSEEADYKIAVFARKYRELWVNVNYTNNLQGFETSFLNNAHFLNLTTQSLPTDYNNNRVFYKHSQALIYEILE